jgi:cyanophycinase
MSGTIAFVGGGEFSDVVADLDRSLLAAAGTNLVTVLPTADAFEQPMRGVERAIEHFAKLGATATGLPILKRPDANDATNAAAVAASRFVYLFGDSPMHLRSVLKDTATWDALLSVLANGGVIAASAAAASGLCEPMVDPRGGGFGLGLGLVESLALITQSETWSEDQLKRSLALASGFAVATMPSGSSIVRSGDGPWAVSGGAAITWTGGAAQSRG